ncbi:hypothetical protein ACVWXR_002862 [Pseudomonas lurida]
MARHTVNATPMRQVIDLHRHDLATGEGADAIDMAVGHVVRWPGRQIVFLRSGRAAPGAIPQARSTGAQHDAEPGVQRALDGLVSQLLSRQAQADSLLVHLLEATIRGPSWALLTDRDSEHDPLARRFTAWLLTHLQVGPT